MATPWSITALRLGILGSKMKHTLKSSTVVRHNGARDLVMGPFRQSKWLLRLYWLKLMQTQTEFLLEC